MKETKNGVMVDLGELDNSDWMVRLLALGSFLRGFYPDHEVLIYAYEDEHIGGLRISEIDFVNGKGGMGAWAKGDTECRLTLAYCEDFCATSTIKPHRPRGWESCLNLHGEAKINLLESMNLEAEAKAEYAAQLEEEKSIA